MRNNTLLVVVVLVLILLGAFFLFNNRTEAPTEENQGASGTVLEGEAGENWTDTPGTQGSSGGTNANLDANVSVGAVKEFTVSGKNFSFSPSTIRVKKGDRVKVTFVNSEGFHDFVIDEYGVATKQLRSPASEVIEFTANKTGSFEYYCSVGTHRAMGMKGTLIVE